MFTGFWVAFWSRFVSVRCLDSGELLMSADRVRHGVVESKGPLVAISKQPTCRKRQIWSEISSLILVRYLTKPLQPLHRC